jgi:hypothetical protein
MLSNLEIIEWNKFRGLPILDEAVGQVQFASQRNSLNWIISKLDRHVVLLLVNYIMKTIQLYHEKYENNTVGACMGLWIDDTIKLYIIW